MHVTQLYNIISGLPFIEGVKVALHGGHVFCGHVPTFNKFALASQGTSFFFAPSHLCVRFCVIICMSGVTKYNGFKIYDDW